MGRSKSRPRRRGWELRAHSFVGGLGQRNEGGGVYYARQRWYDSSLGRWLSADPIEFKGGLNLYAYVGNNPVGWVDPEGLQPPFQLPKMPTVETLKGRKLPLPPYMPEEGAMDEDKYGHPRKYQVPPGRAKLIEPWGTRPGQNCHGYTVRTKGLARVPKDKTLGIMLPDTMSGVLKDAQTAGVIRPRGRGEAPQVGDVVIYGNYEHSGVITGMKGKTPVVTSDWGDWGVYEHEINDIHPAYKNMKWLYYECKGGTK